MDVYPSPLSSDLNRSDQLCQLQILQQNEAEKVLVRDDHLSQVRVFNLNIFFKKLSFIKIFIN